MVIAIDGPVGSGKSTVAKALALRLGFNHLDSGAMYRCVALGSLRLQRDPVEVAQFATIELGDRVLFGGEDVTEAIRAPEVSERTSQIAALSGVRTALVAEQRRLMSSGDWVAEGRDIGTVVAPDAELKVFLTAEPRERARRRALQSGLDEEQVLADLTARDQRDQTRAVSPLKSADGAVVLDSTGLTLDEVVERIAALAGRG